MLDWKILAASIVALLFISSLFLGGFGLGDTFSDLIDNIGNYLGNTPFDGIFPSSTSSNGNKEVSILLSPETFSFEPEAEITLTSDQTTFSGFSGTVTIHFTNSTVLLESGTLEIGFPLDELGIDPLEISSLSLEAVPFKISPDISTESGSIEIKGFSGEGLATAEGIELHGNVTSLNVEIGGISLELV